MGPRSPGGHRWPDATGWYLLPADNTNRHWPQPSPKVSLKISHQEGFLGKCSSRSTSKQSRWRGWLSRTVGVWAALPHWSSAHRRTLARAALQLPNLRGDGGGWGVKSDIPWGPHSPTIRVTGYITPGLVGGQGPRCPLRRRYVTKLKPVYTSGSTS